MFSKSDWSSEIFSYLEENLTGRKFQTALFDFDNTLVRGDFGEEVMCELLRAGVPWIRSLSPFFPETAISEKMETLRKTNTQTFMVEVWNYYESKIEKEGLEAGYRWSTWIFSGRSTQELQDTAKLVWEKNQKDTNPEAVQAFHPMSELVKEFERVGTKIWILTASPAPVIQVVSEQWGIPKENVLGMRLIEKNGILSHELIEPFTYGIGKVEFLNLANGNQGYDIAFGDSENDFPMLSYVRSKGIFLDRGKKKIPPPGTLIQSVADWKTIPKPL
ncbi:HAD family hydrolase [Leptospira licerasiae]|uniref:Haloacid dehalogenase-like hydrolase n=1 Tax=Leptospira licerasiae str. MMD4847 TaxID=1049971 RepID=A0ABN0HA40_9LEPT|nr:haloacid dehalogenase-like hydrolase [Leptospira licerasiae]EIE03436.1 haloacid dehalogenase-like hydrolase [Leptospira licerasiae serovar Varillal str. VAR 010]EJZ42217.1 haloacid dehalogenase-like hydrolase [Leptospira licerasiae str. MMD4847]